MARRSSVLVFSPFLLLVTGLCFGCGQKSETPASPPAPPASNTQYPPGYVEQRNARERPMPLNTQTGK
jgi:hypothetical protein